MNIVDSLKCARENNFAITRGDFRNGEFLQHGMDNVLRFQDGSIMNFSVHDLLSDQYEMDENQVYQKGE